MDTDRVTSDRWFCTNQLRSADDEIWSALRSHLVQRGIDPATSVIDAFPDGLTIADIEQDASKCVLVTADRRVFRFLWTRTLTCQGSHWCAHDWRDELDSWHSQRWMQTYIRWAFAQVDASETA